MKRHISLKIFFVILFFSLLSPKIGLASSLSISPATGNFSVGSTFNISILLDTKGKSINALEARLSFPPDKLQVVSPSTGESIIGVWTTSPKFNNTLGTLELQGGIPGGIITSNGVLTKITFRVKSTGAGIIKFLDKSKVFLDDGLATEDLNHTESAVYEFRLPPPEGPVVVSDTHPDQSIWYPTKMAILRFGSAYAEGFSYVLSSDPDTIPDNISEGTKASVAYTNLSDGVNYFHIKSLRGGVWGGTTHFVIRTDTTSPAQFPVEILPSARTTSTKPVIQFTTTDAASGLDHYELKLVPLSTATLSPSEEGTSNFFIETRSPYLTDTLSLGSYDVIVRAYDKANNYREVTKRFVITTPFFRFIGESGVQVGNMILVPWIWVWIVGALLLLILGYMGHKVWHWHGKVHAIQKEKKLPDSVVHQLEELKEYRKKYGAKMVILLFAVLSMLFYSHSIQAQTRELTPPSITYSSKVISNKEIFYAGGRTDDANETVIMYLQNMQTGETLSETIQSNKNGDWFYRNNGFLTPGNYILWTQSKKDEQLSPPSSPTTMSVKETAIQFGANRLSYEAIYLMVIVILGLGIIGLASFILYHMYHGRRKHEVFIREVSDAEESIRRGFAVLRRDIEGELALFRNTKPSAELSLEEKEKEAQLLLDLNTVQKRIGKEVWEIKKESW